jgi:hypothetical protein
MKNEDDHEYREEENQRRHDQRYTPWIDPRDPNYIGPEDEEE